MKYPLYKNARSSLKLPSGVSVELFSLRSLEDDKLTSEDLGIHEDTLRAQAVIASESGFPQLAANLGRAAELARIPDHEILDIYEALRPGRTDRARLEHLAERLEKKYSAQITADFIRDAATAADPER